MPKNNLKSPSKKRLRPSDSPQDVADKATSPIHETEIVGGSSVTVNPYKKFHIDEKEIHKFETNSAKKVRIEFEAKKNGIPKMTENGPGCGSIFPPEGICWQIEYNPEKIPVRLAILSKDSDDSQDEKIEITPAYRVWFKTFRDSFFPNLETKLNPRELETVFGAGLKLLKWARLKPENRQRLISSEPILKDQTKEPEE